MSTEERNPESGEELTSLNADNFDLDQLDDAALVEVAGGVDQAAAGVEAPADKCGVFAGPCDRFTGSCGTFG